MVLGDGQGAEKGEKTVKEITQKIGIGEADLVDSAYIDLITKTIHQ